jgi:hypothetical protein
MQWWNKYKLAILSGLMITIALAIGFTRINGENTPPVHAEYAAQSDPTLIINGDFSAGMQGWGTWGAPTQSAIQHRITNGRFEFYRQPGTQQAVVLQDTHTPLTAGTNLFTEVSFANTSTVRKRVSVLLHDTDFSDSQICSFWIPPLSPMRRYVVQTFIAEDWASTVLSVYASSADGIGWLQMDNVAVRVWTPPVPGTTICWDAKFGLTETPTTAPPTCEPGRITASTAQISRDTGVVRFTIYNNRTVYTRLEGFKLNWSLGGGTTSPSPGLQLYQVYASLFDIDYPMRTLLWTAVYPNTGDETPPTLGRMGNDYPADRTWLTNVGIPAGTPYNIYFVFRNFSGTLAQNGVTQPIFNGTQFFLYTPQCQNLFEYTPAPNTVGGPGTEIITVPQVGDQGTFTPTPTDSVPQCQADLLLPSQVVYEQDVPIARFSVTNRRNIPVRLSGFRIVWRRHGEPFPFPTGMQLYRVSGSVDRLNESNRVLLWQAGSDQDAQSPTFGRSGNAPPAELTWLNSAEIPPGMTYNIYVQFRGIEGDLPDNNIYLSFFNDTQFYFMTQACPSLNEYTPVPGGPGGAGSEIVDVPTVWSSYWTDTPTSTPTNTLTLTPTPTPTATRTQIPECRTGLVLASAVMHEPVGAIARYTITNTRIVPIRMVGFSINWSANAGTVPPVAGMQLFEVYGSPDTLSNPGRTLLWQAGTGEDAAPPTFAHNSNMPLGEPSWLNDWNIPPGTTYNLYLLFRGIGGSLSANGINRSVFNGTQFYFTTPACEAPGQPTPTWVMATNFPTETATHTSTSTPSPTPTTPSEAFTCDRLWLYPDAMIGDVVTFVLVNTYPAALQLDRIQVVWPQLAQFPNMGVGGIGLNGNVIWAGLDTQPPTTIGGAEPNDGTFLPNANRTILAGSDTVPSFNSIMTGFSNGPSFVQSYMGFVQFHGTTVTVRYGDMVCTLTFEVQYQTATPSNTPSATMTMTATEPVGPYQSPTFSSTPTMTNTPTITFTPMNVAVLPCSEDCT